MVIKALDPYWIRIRIGLQHHTLDPDPEKMNTDPQPCLLACESTVSGLMVQALGMLFWHKHDLDRATQDLANFTPFPDEWSVEDKVLFEQAFQVPILKLLPSI